MSAPRVAVVGAGAAGLAAAARLASVGADVTLLEAGDRVGGHLCTVHRDGWTVESGALLVAEPPPPVREFLDSFGLAARTVRVAPTARRRYVVHQGCPQPIPSTLGDLIASPLLSIAGRLRMAREPFVAKRGSEDDETVDTFARRRFGDEVAERLFDSLVTEMSGGDSTRSLVRYLFPKLVEFERETGSVLKGQVRAGMEARRRNRGKPTGGWSCAGGLSELATVLGSVSGIRHRPGTRVDQVTPSGSGFTLRAQGEAESFDGVVMAISAPALGRIGMPSEAQDLLEQVASIPYAPVASVSLGYARDAVAHPLDGLSIRVPSCEGRPILTILAPLTAFPGRAPEGQVLVSCLVGGVAHPEVAALDETTLLAMVREQLASLIGAKGEPTFTNVGRWHEAFPQPVAGHGSRLAAADALEQVFAGLRLAGSWRDGLSVSEVLRGGLRAADATANHVGLSRP